MDAAHSAVVPRFEPCFANVAAETVRLAPHRVRDAASVERVLAFRAESARSHFQDLRVNALCDLRSVRLDLTARLQAPNPLGHNGSAAPQLLGDGSVRRTRVAAKQAQDLPIQLVKSARLVQSEPFTIMKA